MVAKLVDVPSRFNCCQVPSVHTLKQIVVDVARYEFTVKSLSAVIVMRSGFPEIYNEFWKEYSCEDMFSLYKAMCATPSTVLEI